VREGRGLHGALEDAVHRDAVVCAQAARGDGLVRRRGALMLRPAQLLQLLLLLLALQLLQLLQLQLLQAKQLVRLQLLLLLQLRQAGRRRGRRGVEGREAAQGDSPVAREALQRSAGPGGRAGRRRR